MSALPLPRRSIVEALRPPEGWFVAAAVGTTFSLDPQALVAALLALAGDDGDSEDAEAQLAAVLRLRDRVRVFVHAGGMKAPSRPSRVHALLERVVEEVRLPGASFHPKVWVLELRPRDAAQRVAGARFRVICGSRNLTRAQSWEIAIQLEGEPASDGRPPSGASANVAAFVRTVLAEAKSTPKVLHHLAKALPEVRLEPCRESRGSLEFRWQWPQRKSSLGELLPAKAKRILVISPFVNATFLDQLEGVAPDVLVVSTQPQLDALSATRVTRLKRKGFVFKVVKGRQDLPDYDALDLHAKVVLVETDLSRRTILGSANATRAGFGLTRYASDPSDTERGGRNAEAVVVLRPGLDRRSLESGFLDGPLVAEWTPPTTGDVRGREPLWALEALRDQLLDSEFKATWDRATRALTLRATAPLPDGLERPGLRASVWPAQLRRKQAAAVAATATQSGAAFVPVDAGQVTRFFAFALVDEGSKERVEWVHGAELADDEEREREVQEALLEGRSPLALVERLLAAGGWTRVTPPPPPPDDGAPGAKRPPGHRSPPSTEKEDVSTLTLEQLVEACTAERGLIPEIDALVQRWTSGTQARSAPAGSEERFEAFVTLWTRFHGAWKRVEGDRG